MSARDGGPAFPAPGKISSKAYGMLPGEVPRLVHTQEEPASSGMTLRDYFAAKALHGLLHAESHGDYSNEHIAVIAYMLADAMLKAREVQP
jgi:hypothetical protein